MDPIGKECVRLLWRWGRGKAFQAEADLCREEWDGTACHRVS